MISCLLIHVSRNPQGLPVCKDSVITGPSIQIGRGAACNIHLLDHRVGLLHATIARSEHGALHIIGEGNATLKVNGFIAQSAPLLPGTHVEIGPYELIVEPAAGGHDLILSIELIHALVSQDNATPATPVTLAALGLSKRRLGFAMAACILFLFLLLPVLSNTSLVPDSWQARLPLTLNGSWSPGPLASGHARFESKCSTCHKRPFEAVSDKVCTDCHKQVGKHLPKEDLQIKSFQSMHCTDCHIDHKGSERLVLHDSSKCVTCHGDLKKKMVSTELGNVEDFERLHPPFHLTLHNEKDTLRLRQDDKARLVERSGLKYSHQVHLAKEGVSSPQGDTVMQCRDCHKLEESGRHFEPMTMQKSCQQSGCHSLDFTEPVDGLAPHGSEHAVMDRLREFYIKWLSESAENSASCGQNSDIQSTLACADKLAKSNAATTLFRKNKECGECHEIHASEDPDSPWQVAPVHINRDWQPGATFVHAKHNTMNCADCHDKNNSKSSADISMPPIAKCRECHVGNRPGKDKISSGCDSCHRFHQHPK